MGCAPVGLPLLVLTSRPTDRRCRRIDSRRSLLSAAIVLVKARYQFADVLFDPGTRHADQRPLDVVPELPRLRLHGAVTATAGLTATADRGRPADLG